MKSDRTAKWLTSRRSTIIVGAVGAYISILSIFAFRNLPYLSDGTFYIAEWPFACFAVVVVLLLVNLYLVSKKRTRPRKILAILSALAVVSVLINAIAFAFGGDGTTSDRSHAAQVASPSRPIPAGPLFMAGAARGEITPSDYLMPMPLLYILKFRWVNDPVYARVLAMSDGTQQYLFITLDMTLVPEAEETLQFIHQQTGIPIRNIFISATHTHGTTPISLIDYTNPADRRKSRKWYEEIKRTLVSTIAKARSNMVPARYGYGEGQSLINVNRDIVVGKKSELGSNFDRPSDKTIRMVRIEDLNGKVISLIVNYAVHSVVMNGSLSGIGTPITGDIAGRTSAKIEGQWGDAVVLWTMAAAGDQNPRFMTQYTGPIKDGEPVRRMLGSAGSAILEYLSDEHVRDILKANAGFEATQTAPEIHTAEATALVDTIDAGKKQPYKLRLLTLGDIAFQGISAEVVTSIGKAVRETSPFQHTILVTAANGYEGYVADDWEYDHQAFEVGDTRVKKGAVQPEFVKGFTGLFGDLTPRVSQVMTSSTSRSR
ncbi:hypothetical protein [Sphingopyxis sp.]|uniref:hypothetical protein n=1 Tax=Sphingopyxis sp. TaxID=1908224 RepID=UPI002DF3BE27|nr:hypothetical protein [Sphingopyxis sp.]